jgi:hypothetical protein
VSTREHQRDRELREKSESDSGSSRKSFLKRIMGAPDSLQCLFGAHRTAHSSYPVNHRTTQCRKGICVRPAGAPDSA